MKKHTQNTKRILITIFYIVVFSSIGAIFWLQGDKISTSGKAIETTTCIDSDGFDVFNKGTVTADNDVFTDTCTQTGNFLFSGAIEYFCEGNNKESKLVNCDCDDGACKEIKKNEETIDTCLTLDKPDTEYKLTKDIEQQGHCFSIQADGITLNCDDHTITFYDGNAVSGNHNNLEIKNCHFSRKTLNPRGAALNFRSVKDLVVSKNTFDIKDGPTNYPILIHGSENVQILDNIVSISISKDTPGLSNQNRIYAYGISLGGGNKHIIKRNTIMIKASDVTKEVTAEGIQVMKSSGHPRLLSRGDIIVDNTIQIFGNPQKSSVTGLILEIENGRVERNVLTLQGARIDPIFLSRDSNNNIIKNTENRVLRKLQSCGNLPDSNSVYELTKNINSGGTCFSISGKGIIFDCKGHSITFADGRGITGQGENITIKNCNFIRTPTRFNSFGIDFEKSKNMVIEDNEFTFTDGPTNYPISVHRSQGTVINGNNINIMIGENSKTASFEKFYARGITLSGGRQTINKIANNEITIDVEKSPLPVSSSGISVEQGSGGSNSEVEISNNIIDMIGNNPVFTDYGMSLNTQNSLVKDNSIKIRGVATVPIFFFSNSNNREENNEIK